MISLKDLLKSLGKHIPYPIKSVWKRTNSHYNLKKQSLKHRSRKYKYQCGNGGDCLSKGNKSCSPSKRFFKDLLKLAKITTKNKRINVRRKKRKLISNCETIDPKISNPSKCPTTSIRRTNNEVRKSLLEATPELQCATNRIAELVISQDNVKDPRIRSIKVETKNFKSINKNNTAPITAAKEIGEAFDDSLISSKINLNPCPYQFCISKNNKLHRRPIYQHITIQRIPDHKSGDALEERLLKYRCFHRNNKEINNADVRVERLAKDYKFLYNESFRYNHDQLVDEATDQTSKKNNHHNYWVYYFHLNIPNVPPPSLDSLYKPSVNQLRSNASRRNTDVYSNTQSSIDSKPLNNLALPENKRVGSEENLDRISNKVQSKNIEAVKIGKVIDKKCENVKSDRQCGVRISGGAIKRPLGLTYRQAVMNKQKCGKKPTEQQNEEEMVEEEVEVEAPIEPSPCCGHENCLKGQCWLKKSRDDLPCVKEEYSDDDTIGKAIANPKPKLGCFNSDIHQFDSELPHRGTLFSATYYRRFAEMEANPKVPHKTFEIISTYYPHERYPPQYHAYKTSSMLRLRNKVPSRQTPEEKPKSPIGTAKRCKRTKVEKDTNTDFCCCSKHNFQLRPCKCKPKPPPPSCTCAIPLPKCGCAEREAKLNDKYNLYNNRKILRRCISKSEDRLEDPCDKRVKKFNMDRERYDRIDSKCLNPFCGTCFKDPNIQLTYEVKDTFCKTRCLKELPVDSSESLLTKDEDECPEEEHYSLNEMSCTIPKHQFDSIQQREKKAKKYPYNKVDVNESLRIRSMLKNAFKSMNNKEEEEEELEQQVQEDNLMSGKVMERIIESDESNQNIKDFYCKKRDRKMPPVCNKLKQIQLTRQYKGFEASCFTLANKLNCSCRQPSVPLITLPVCGYVKQWYCLPPKKIVDSSLFQLLPNIENRRSVPQKQHRCDPYDLPL